MKTQELLRKEHESVRNNVGFFDFAHDILEVTGKDSKDFLDFMCVNVISKMEPYSASYTTILDRDGVILDDVIVFYHEEDKFWVTTLFIKELLPWFEKHKGNREVEFKDVTDEVSLYSVQGPNSRKTLNDMLEKDISDLGYFRFMDNKIGDIPVKVSRTGFTGELGYELYFHPKYTDKIIDSLLKKGEPYGVHFIKTDVTLTSLPTEKGYITVDDFAGANPIELDLEWSVDCEKDFMGKDTLCKIKKQGPSRKLLGFTVEEDNLDIKKGDIVKSGDKEIGKVTTFTYAFTVEKNIGYVLIDSKYANPGDKVTILSDSIEIQATLKERVFYDPKQLRVKS